MLFPEEDSPVLKEWIVKRLENTFVTPARLHSRYCASLVTSLLLLTLSYLLDRTPMLMSSQTTSWHFCTMRTTATTYRAYLTKK